MKASLNLEYQKPYNTNTFAIIAVFSSSAFPLTWSPADGFFFSASWSSFPRLMKPSGPWSRRALWSAWLHFLLDSCKSSLQLSNLTLKVEDILRLLWRQGWVIVRLLPRRLSLHFVNLRRISRFNHLLIAETGPRTPAPKLIPWRSGHSIAGFH